MSTERIISDMSDCYFSLAGTELPMNFYSLYEAWVRTDEELQSGTLPRTPLDRLAGGQEFFDRTTALVSAIYAEGATPGEAEYRELISLRERIKAETLALAAYSDRFKLYEYILNRVAGAGQGEAEDTDIDSATRDILTRIFATKDNSTINANIRQAVAQLPLRMTRQRFFDILEESLKKYIGGDKSSLDRAAYMISSASGIWDIDRKLDCFEDDLKAFDNMPWSMLDAEGVRSAETRLKSVVSVILDTTDLFQSLAEIINLASAYVLTYNSTDETAHQQALSMKPVITEALEGLKNGTRNEMSSEVLACFETTEGRLEQQVERVCMLEAKLDQRTDLADEPELKKLQDCRKLMSSSLFIDLEEQESSDTVDEAYATQVCAKLCAAYEQAFTGADRIMNRARMAAALAELPVFFNSRTEVMNYVRDSLDGCRDRYERLVAIRLVLEALS